MLGIRRRDFVTLMGGIAVTLPLTARAQQAAGKVWHVGMLETASRELSAANVAAFERGLRELGYTLGQNLVIDYRSSDGLNEGLHDLASDLVRLNVDVIVLRGTPQALAAKNATSTIPVVMAAVADPVGSGIVDGLAHPGGNITGLSTFYTELEAKRVELLKEMVPYMKRMATLVNLSNPATATQWEEVRRAAGILGVEVRRLDVRNAADVGRAFEITASERVEAIAIAIDTLTSTNRRQIIELAAKQRVPAIYASREFADEGGLMSYGVSYPQLYYRAASFVDKIFKGEKPANIPVEQPTKVELILNLKTGKALGLTVPLTLLAIADEVIE